MSYSEEYSHSAFIRGVLTKTFDVANGSFTIHRDGTATNNHVYMIHLTEPTKSELRPKESCVKPFTSPVPEGTSRLVMRIPKPDSNLEDDIRTRNEVACLALARNAVADIDPLLFPRVFSWDDAAVAGGGSPSPESPGYILEEFMAGELMSWDELRALGPESAGAVCKQLARVAKALQAYKLPAGITGYGGVTFNDAGELSSTKDIFRTGGPYATYGEYLKATILWQLAQSENIDVLNGWRDVPEALDLRERIDTFLSEGLDALLSKVPEHRPTLVHGDLTLPNILFDKSTNTLTAVVDFDFGHIGSPLTEYLYSFAEFHGILLGAAEPQDGVRDLVLNGWPGAVAPDRAMGKMWEDALAAEGAQRPSTMEGADVAANLWWFGQELLQFHWMIPRMHEHMSAEEKKRSRAKSMRRIELYLDNWGYENHVRVE